jgi:hypothetical protein
MIREPDAPIDPPANPGANGDAIVFESMAWAAAVPTVRPRGVKMTLFFDQDVSLFLEDRATAGGTWRVVNGSPAGTGQVVTASVPAQFKVPFLGVQNRIRLRTGGTPPSVWHISAVASEDWPL